MKKGMLCTLLIAALLTSMSACRNSSSPSSPDQTANTESQNTETAAVSDGFSLPDTNWNGREFRVLGYEGNYPQYSTFEIYTEGETGEVVNDAIYRRNLTIEERYNVKISEVFSPDSNTNNADLSTVPALRKNALPGEDLYDLAFVTVSNIGLPAREHLLYDLNEVGYLNLEADWWNKEANDMISMTGKQFFASSDFSLRDKNRAYIGIYNKDMVKRYAFDDPVELVRNGKWTLDVLTAWAIDVSSDVNGNAEIDDNDQFGITADSFNAFQTFITACNNPILQKDGNDIPIVALNSDHMVNTIDKVLKLTTRKDVTIYCDEWQGKVDYDFWSVSGTVFREGRSLFNTAFPHSLSNYSANSTCDYGILPFPKYDEEQKTYYTQADRYAMLFCIPTSNPEPDFAGFMLEALSHEATDTSLKAYYEISCKTKYTYDEDSAEMLDLIFSGIIYDTARMYAINGLTDVIYNIAKKRVNTLSSDYASIEKKASRDLEKMLEDINSAPSLS